MNLKTKTIRLLYLISLWSLGYGQENTAKAESRYSQVVLPLPTERSFRYHFEPMDRALVLEIDDTSPNELEPLFHYDERMVQRLLMKDMGGKGTEVRVVLRDDLIKVMVNSFKEPFRITLDLFDADYHESVDPKTGLPLLNVADSIASGYEPKKSNQIEMVAPQGQATQRATPTIEASQVSSPTSGKRRLMQPLPEGIRNPNDLILKVNEISGGIGKAWKTYPPYVQRIQVATVKKVEAPNLISKKAAESAMSSSEALAQYAGQQFDFGHEGRALVVYQKLLHEDPAVFERQPDAIWRLGEIHLGQGNLTLADGYYESLIAKHPDHPLAGFAAMRRLDIQAIRANQEQNGSDIAGLAPEISKITATQNPLLNAQLALRQAYWLATPEMIQAMMPAYTSLPQIKPNTLVRLRDSRENADNPRTAFLIDSILFSNRLENEVWNPELAQFADKYLDRYKGTATEPYRTDLKNKCEKNIIEMLKRNYNEQKYAETIQIVESLPKSFLDLKKGSDVSWMAAESYRQLKQPISALPFYERAAQTAGSKIDRFRANYHKNQVISTALDHELVVNPSSDRINKLQDSLKTADQASLTAWSSMNSDEKNQIYTEIKDDLEKELDSTYPTKTAAKILLEVWGQKLGSELPSLGPAINSTQEEGQASLRFIPLLAKLIKRFDKLGLMEEKRKTKIVLSRIKVKGSPIDRQNLKIWTNETSALAEELRKENQYLEAGRLYTEVGSSNTDWEGRAESLYKGGLLLYRSGRREEALAAFQQAASDVNNTLYAELAKKRMEQIQQ